MFLIEKAISLILQYGMLEKMSWYGRPNPEDPIKYFIIGPNGQIWSFGSVIWLRIFGHPVFIYSVVWFWSNGPNLKKLVTLMSKNPG